MPVLSIGTEDTRLNRKCSYKGLGKMVVGKQILKPTKEKYICYNERNRQYFDIVIYKK